MVWKRSPTGFYLGPEDAKSCDRRTYAHSWWPDSRREFYCTQAKPFAVTARKGTNHELARSAPVQPARYGSNGGGVWSGRLVDSLPLCRPEPRNPHGLPGGPTYSPKGIDRTPKTGCWRHCPEECRGPTEPGETGRSPPPDLATAGIVCLGLTRPGQPLRVSGKTRVRTLVRACAARQSKT